MKKGFDYLRPDGKTEVGPVGLRAVLKAAGTRILAADAPFIIIKDGGHRYPANTRRRALKQLKGILSTSKVGARVVVHKFIPDTKPPSPGEAGHAAGKVGGPVFSAHSVKVSIYDNPVRSIRGLQQFRQDMGVDYGGSGAIYAPGPGKITRYDKNSSWPGKMFIAMVFTDGPAKGKGWYLAENLTLNPKLRVGSKVDANTVLATLHAAFPHCEMGWATPSGSAPMAYPFYHEGDRTCYGDNASKFLQALGAPGGLTEGRNITGHLAGGFPRSWKNKV